jgi:hypothetical protein
MNYRALLLATLLTTPTTACADDPAPEPPHDYSLCGRMRVNPSWCREHDEQQRRERDRDRARQQEQEPHS